MAGKVRCHPTFRLYSVQVQGRGDGSGSMPHVKSGAPSHAEAGRHLSRFPVPEPGRAWLGLLWPTGGAGFGPQHVVFLSSPHPSPRAHKRGSAELLESLLSLPRSSSEHYWCAIAVQSAVLLRELLLRGPDPRRLPSFETPCRAVDVPPPPRSQTDQCGAHVATGPGE